jgi:hypothetical protein
MAKKKIFIPFNVATLAYKAEFVVAIVNGGSFQLEL